jgi:predicted DNA-binding protein YlxM (UPF0122 family)
MGIKRVTKDIENIEKKINQLKQEKGRKGINDQHIDDAVKMEENKLEKKWQELHQLTGQENLELSDADKLLGHLG